MPFQISTIASLAPCQPHHFAERRTREDAVATGLADHPVAVAPGDLRHARRVRRPHRHLDAGVDSRARRRSTRALRTHRLRDRRDPATPASRCGATRARRAMSPSSARSAPSSRPPSPGSAVLTLSAVPFGDRAPSVGPQLPHLMSDFRTPVRTTTRTSDVRLRHPVRIQDVRSPDHGFGGHTSVTNAPLRSPTGRRRHPEEARGEAHRRATDGGLDPRLTAGVARRRLPRGGARASAPGSSSTSAVASASETAALAAPDRARDRRRLQRADRRRDGARTTRAVARPAVRGDGRRRARDPRRRVDYVVSSHIIEHFVNPVLHVAELARVAATGRHRLRDHTERAGRLREPVPRLPVRTRTARVDAAAVLRGRRVPRPRRRRRAPGRLRRTQSQRRADPPSRSLRHPPSHPATRATCGRTNRRCRPCTGSSAPKPPGSGRASTRVTCS